MANKSPFEFFEDLLKENKYEHFKEKFLKDYEREFGYLNFKNRVIDYEEGVIREDEETELSFAHSFITLIKGNINYSKTILEKNALEITYLNNSPLTYFTYQENILDNLILKAKKIYPDFIELYEELIELKTYIELRTNSNSFTSRNPLSYIWDSTDEEDSIFQLTKLYEHLLSYKIIESSKSDFINAFTGKEVIHGIKWRILTKDNNNTSKPSLFSFIDYLMEQNFIIDKNEKDYNDSIKYVFRDFNGSQLKNIRQSKSASTNEIAPLIKDFIDELI